MSRHSGKRRRRARSTAPAVPPRPPRPITAAPRLEERPRTPWHPFPLVELAVLVGIVCIVAGFLSRADASGRTLLALGVALGSLGGLDTAVREHFSGFRSHALVLAAFPAVVAAVLVAVAGAPFVAVPPVLVIVFAAALAGLRRAWDRAADRSPA